MIQYGCVGKYSNKKRNEERMDRRTDGPTGKRPTEKKAKE